MSVKSELLEIQAADENGLLHPSAVVAWARANTASALHRLIEWDDRTAADSHRLWQVRQIIQLHIVAEDGTPQAVSLTIDRRSGGGYRKISDVLQAPDLREVMLNDALDELERVRTKYERVTELARVWAEAQATQERVGTRRRGRRAVTTDTVAAT
jgi:hypothetical protein